MPGSWSKYPRLLIYGVRRGGLRARRAVAEMMPAGYRNLLEKEATHWKKGEKGHTWLDSSTIQALANAEISGDEQVYWLLHFMRKHLPTGDGPGLVLGCGTGGLELNAVSIGLCNQFHSFDISKGALDKCKQAVESADGEIETFKADLNKISLVHNFYAIAFAVNILHHLVDLEHVLDEVKKSLRPGGFFVVHEYVGPARFQWTEAQIGEAGRILASMPRKYRRNRRKGFMSRQRLYLPPLDATSRDSPFEAARSDEIVPLLEKRFEVVEKVNIGGALLHPLLEAIVENFDDNNPKDREMLVDLWRREKDLMAKGVLGNDFVYAVLRKVG